jgi:anti-sigma B factor antagonist
MGVTAMAGIDVGRLDAFVLAEDDAGGTVVHIAGQVDLATAADLEGRLRDALERRPGPVVLDLAGVDFIDSSGLNVLLAAHRSHPGRLRLGPTSRRVDRVLEISGTRGLFD